MNRAVLVLAAALWAAPLAAQQAQADSAAGMHQLLELVRSDFRTQTGQPLLQPVGSLNPEWHDG